MSASEVALAVARAGWPVVPVRTDTDEKAPCVKWKADPASVCRSEADVVGKWPATWPRWAAICGVPRARDGRALANLDADDAKAAEVARAMLPHHTRVRTGRSGGEHTWVGVPPDLADGLLRRFYVHDALDWRGGDCISLLPGSLWAPRSHPEVVYSHLDGPVLPEVVDLPPGVAAAFLRRAPSPGPTRGRAVDGAADLGAGGAFERFLAAVAASGRTVNRVAGRPGQALVQCPGAGHPDGNRNRPCLHVSARGAGIALHCFGNRGCTAAGVVAALGLGLGDLYDPLDITDVVVTGEETER